jgi:Protein NO VEIN, C-terminal
MVRYFIHYWKEREFEKERKQSVPGDKLERTEGNFSERGILPGDFVYAISNLKGRVFLLGRLQVKEIRDLGSNERSPLWNERMEANPRQLTEKRFDKEVPASVIRKLDFRSAAGKTKAKFKNGHLDQQTLARKRELTPESAALLDPFVHPVSDTAEADSGHNATEGADGGEESRDDDLENEFPPSSQGYMRQAARRRAVELCALEAAVAHYEALYPNVEDTSETRPYDLCCRMGQEEVRVEVKGSQGNGTKVFLTAGEVQNALSSGVRTDLFVWGHIKIVDDGVKPRGIGGQMVSHLKGWKPSDADLNSTQYSYKVPGQATPIGS